MDFGAVIRDLRKEKGLTSSQLAKKAGISQAYLSQLETGKNKNPTNNIINKLSKGLKIDYIQLLAKVGYVDDADRLKSMATTSARSNKETQKQMDRINKDGKIINPQGKFKDPDVTSKELNVPKEYKVNGVTKEFNNIDFFNPYNYFSMAIDRNDLFPLTNSEGKKIDVEELKKILPIIKSLYN